MDCLFAKALLAEESILGSIAMTSLCVNLSTC
jgi:hypothetical protein